MSLSALTKRYVYLTPHYIYEGTTHDDLIALEISGIFNLDLKQKNKEFEMDGQLWYALGKVRAEKAAWEIAKDSGLKLATICPGLIGGSEFYERNWTSTIAYLKGVQEMYAYGLLATVNVESVAKAHVRVFEETKKSASGRYICFDKVIKRMDEIETLAAETGISTSALNGGANSPRFELSNVKLAGLMLRTRRCLNE